MCLRTEIAPKHSSSLINNNNADKRLSQNDGEEKQDKAPHEGELKDSLIPISLQNHAARPLKGNSNKQKHFVAIFSTFTTSSNFSLILLLCFMAHRSVLYTMSSSLLVICNTTDIIITHLLIGLFLLSLREQQIQTKTSSRTSNNRTSLFCCVSLSEAAFLRWACVSYPLCVWMIITLTVHINIDSKHPLLNQIASQTITVSFKSFAKSLWSHSVFGDWFYKPSHHILTTELY